MIILIHFVREIKTEASYNDNLPLKDISMQ